MQFVVNTLSQLPGRPDVSFQSASRDLPYDVRDEAGLMAQTYRRLDLSHLHLLRDFQRRHQEYGRQEGLRLAGEGHWARNQMTCAVGDRKAEICEASCCQISCGNFSAMDCVAFTVWPRSVALALRS